MKQQINIYLKNELMCVETNIEFGLPYWEARKEHNKDIRIEIKED